MVIFRSLSISGVTLSLNFFELQFAGVELVPQIGGGDLGGVQFLGVEQFRPFAAVGGAAGAGFRTAAAGGFATGLAGAFFLGFARLGITLGPLGVAAGGSAVGGGLRIGAFRLAAVVRFAFAAGLGAAAGLALIGFALGAGCLAGVA